MDGTDRLRRAIGCADLCELLAAAYSFPGEEFANALADGSFAADAAACLEDAGADAEAIRRMQNALGQLRGQDPQQLHAALKREYSLLYLAPGTDVAVFPYESAFRYIAAGKTGTPSLFRSPVTLDVEKHMREAGVLPKTARTEPCDSIGDELEFISYLCGSYAAALQADDQDAAQQWHTRIGSFTEEHAAQWFPEFFAATHKETQRFGPGSAYGALALFAEEAVRLLVPDKSH